LKLPAEDPAALMYWVDKSIDQPQNLGFDRPISGFRAAQADVARLTGAISIRDPKSIGAIPLRLGVG
jgi:hypothetical protein